MKHNVNNNNAKGHFCHQNAATLKTRSRLKKFFSDVKTENNRLTLMNLTRNH
jgi:hypothetical protein